MDRSHGPWTRRAFLRAGVSASALAALASCKLSAPLAPPAGNVRLTSRPRTPTVTPVRGLSPLSLGGGRHGVLYVPDSYDPTVPAPLFIAMHGAGGSGENWPSYYARAEARWMIFLAPSSRGATWDLVSGRAGADVEYLDTALAYTFDRARVNPARIAFGGFSDGASYALSLGISNGDLFTHLVAYSPGFLAAGGDPVGKPRVFISHGTRDNVLPVTNSRDAIRPGLMGDGYDVRYVEFDGVHEVPSAISDAALDWFLA